MLESSELLAYHVTIADDLNAHHLHAACRSPKEMLLTAALPVQANMRESVTYFFNCPEAHVGCT